MFGYIYRTLLISYIKYTMRVSQLIERIAINLQQINCGCSQNVVSTIFKPNWFQKTS